ncbi:MAG TPA: hypothetical protein VKU85_05095 [bacterium]|nr:hypothetical protein [bacterium]
MKRFTALSRAARALLLAAIPAATVAAAASGPFGFRVDQQNTDVLGGGARSISALGPIGQEFSPSLTSLTDVVLYTKDFAPHNGAGATLTVRIHERTIDGPVLGESDPVHLHDNFSGATHFRFQPISVLPTGVYVIEVLAQGDNWAAVSSMDHYGLGRTIVLGDPIANEDLIFMEGTRAGGDALPGAEEPAAAAQFQQASSIEETSWSRVKSLYR